MTLWLRSTKTPLRTGDYGLTTIDVGALPRWNLSNVYPSLQSDKFREAVSDLRRQVDQLDAYVDDNRISRGTLDKPRTSDKSAKLVIDGFVNRTNSALRLFATLDSFVTVQSRYMMSESEESLAAELDLSGSNAWSKLQGTVSSQVTVEFELERKTQTMPITALQNLKHHPDSTVRRRAYEAELTAWESVREPLAAALNGVKGSVNTLDKRRGRVDALHASLDTSRIDRDTLNTLVTAMQESFPIFRRYLKAKAKRLGEERLPWWDLFAPVGKSARRYTWVEAVDFIIDQFRGFGDRLSKLAQRAVDNHWIDAEPRKGKRGGAFCMRVAGVEESRVLCNFDGSLDQVSTVAHELGHAFHNECQVGKTMLQKTTPMTLAETASIMNQTIISNAAMAQFDHDGQLHRRHLSPALSLRPLR